MILNFEQCCFVVAFSLIWFNKPMVYAMLYRAKVVLFTRQAGACRRKLACSNRKRKWKSNVLTRLTQTVTFERKQSECVHFNLLAFVGAGQYVMIALNWSITFFPLDWCHRVVRCALGLMSLLFASNWAWMQSMLVAQGVPFTEFNILSAQCYAN